MKATTVFRLLVLSLCAFPIVAFIVGTFSVSTLPAPLFDYLQSQQNRSTSVPVSVSPFAFAFALAIIIVVLSVIVGLWRFCRWARTVNVIMTAVYTCCLPLMGHLVLPAGVTPVLYLAYIGQGALIAMAYLPPIADLFATRRA